MQRFLEAEVCRNADQVFTLTEGLRKELVHRGVPRKKIALFPNACRFEEFTPRKKSIELLKKLNIPQDIPVIGYIGSFVQYEGLDDLANACGLLKKQNINFRLLIVGNENVSANTLGPIAAKILEIAEEYDFKEWLIMPGRVPHEEVADYYSLVDIAPFPRKPQPVCEMVSPMKPFEAMAMEKAVVVSSVQALIEIVKSDETGLVFEKGSIESLSDTLKRLIQDAKLREALGKRARRYIETERTWDIVSKNVALTIEKLIAA